MLLKVNANCCSFDAYPNSKINIQSMISSEVQYFDSDFSFEEHARDCIALAQQQQQKLDKSSSSSCDCSVVISHHPSAPSSKLSCCTRNSEDNIESLSPPGDEENTRDGSNAGYDDNTLHPQSQAKFWDAFHTNHSAGNFYKPRRYLVKSFPCIMQYLLDETPCRSSDNSNDATRQKVGELSSAGDDKIVLEIGCGSGSSCIPLIKQYYEVMSEKQKQYLSDDITVVIEVKEQRRIILACDSSPVAVETTRRSLNTILGHTDEMDHAQIGQPKCLFDTFVADPSLTAVDDDNDEKSTYNDKCSFIQEVNRACAKMQASTRGSFFADDDSQQSISDTLVGGGTVGIVLLVFVLSAVTPTRVDRFIENVFLITKPGGKVCFRDYGLYDMPMLRFESSAVCKSAAATVNDPVFVRGEGTIARFFSVESVKEIFASAGFITIELRYCTVFNHNRKTGQKMKRVFVHGIFEKPKL